MTIFTLIIFFNHIFYKKSLINLDLKHGIIENKSISFKSNLKKKKEQKISAKKVKFISPSVTATQKIQSPSFFILETLFNGLHSFPYVMINSFQKHNFYLQHSKFKILHFPEIHICYLQCQFLKNKIEFLCFSQFGK